MNNDAMKPLRLFSIATSKFCPRDAQEQRIRDRLRGIQHGPDDVRDVKHAWSRAAKALHGADPSGAKLAKLLSSMCLLLALCAGCVHWPGVDTHERHPVYPSTNDWYHATP